MNRELLARLDIISATGTISSSEDPCLLRNHWDGNSKLTTSLYFKQAFPAASRGSRILFVREQTKRERNDVASAPANLGAVKLHKVICPAASLWAMGWRRNHSIALDVVSNIKMHAERNVIVLLLPDSYPAPDSGLVDNKALCLYALLYAYGHDADLFYKAYWLHFLPSSKNILIRVLLQSKLKWTISKEEYGFVADMAESVRLRNMGSSVKLTMRGLSAWISDNVEPALMTRERIAREKEIALSAAIFEKAVNSDANSFANKLKAKALKTIKAPDELRSKVYSATISDQPLTTTRNEIIRASLRKQKFEAQKDEVRSNLNNRVEDDVVPAKLEIDIVVSREAVIKMGEQLFPNFDYDDDTQVPLAAQYEDESNSDSSEQTVELLTDTEAGSLSDAISEEIYHHFTAIEVETKEIIRAGISAPPNSDTDLNSTYKKFEAALLDGNTSSDASNTSLIASPSKEEVLVPPQVIAIMPVFNTVAGPATMGTIFEVNEALSCSTPPNHFIEGWGSTAISESPQVTDSTAKAISNSLHAINISSSPMKSTSSTVGTDTAEIKLVSSVEESEVSSEDEGHSIARVSGPAESPGGLASAGDEDIMSGRSDVDSESADNGETQVVTQSCGEQLPANVAALNAIAQIFGGSKAIHSASAAAKAADLRTLDANRVEQQKRNQAEMQRHAHVEQSPQEMREAELSAVDQQLDELEGDSEARSNGLVSVINTQLKSVNIRASKSSNTMLTRKDNGKNEFTRVRKGSAFANLPEIMLASRTKFEQQMLESKDYGKDVGMIESGRFVAMHDTCFMAGLTAIEHLKLFQLMHAYVWSFVYAHIVEVIFGDAANQIDLDSNIAIVGFLKNSQVDHLTRLKTTSQVLWRLLKLVNGLRGFVILADSVRPLIAKKVTNTRDFMSNWDSIKLSRFLSAKFDPFNRMLEGDRSIVKQLIGVWNYVVPSMTTKGFDLSTESGMHSYFKSLNTTVVLGSLDGKQAILGRGGFYILPKVGILSESGSDLKLQPNTVNVNAKEVIKRLNNKTKGKSPAKHSSKQFSEVSSRLRDQVSDLSVTDDIKRELLAGTDRFVTFNGSQNDKDSVDWRDWRRVDVARVKCLVKYVHVAVELHNQRIFEYNDARNLTPDDEGALQHTTSLSPVGKFEPYHTSELSRALLRVYFDLPSINPCVLTCLFLREMNIYEVSRATSAQTQAVKQYISTRNDRKTDLVMRRCVLESQITGKIDRWQAVAAEGKDRLDMRLAAPRSAGLNMRNRVETTQAILVEEEALLTGRVLSLDYDDGFRPRLEQERRGFELLETLELGKIDGDKKTYSGVETAKSIFTDLKTSTLAGDLGLDDCKGLGKAALKSAKLRDVMNQGELGSSKDEKTHRIMATAIVASELRQLTREERIQRCKELSISGANRLSKEDLPKGEDGNPIMIISKCEWAGAHPKKRKEYLKARNMGELIIDETQGCLDLGDTEVSVLSDAMLEAPHETLTPSSGTLVALMESWSAVQDMLDSTKYNALPITDTQVELKDFGDAMCSMVVLKKLERMIQDISGWRKDRTHFEYTVLAIRDATAGIPLHYRSTPKVRITPTKRITLDKGRVYDTLAAILEAKLIQKKAYEAISQHFCTTYMQYHRPAFDQPFMRLILDGLAYCIRFALSDMREGKTLVPFVMPNLVKIIRWSGNNAGGIEDINVWHEDDISDIEMANLTNTMLIDASVKASLVLKDHISLVPIMQEEDLEFYVLLRAANERRNATTSKAGSILEFSGTSNAFTLLLETVTLDGPKYKFEIGSNFGSSSAFYEQAKRAWVRLSNAPQDIMIVVAKYANKYGLVDTFEFITSQVVGLIVQRSFQFDGTASGVTLPPTLRNKSKLWTTSSMAYLDQGIQEWRGFDFLTPLSMMKTWGSGKLIEGTGEGVSFSVDMIRSGSDSSFPDSESKISDSVCGTGPVQDSAWERVADRFCGKLASRGHGNTRPLVALLFMCKMYEHGADIQLVTRASTFQEAFQSSTDLNKFMRYRNEMIFKPPGNNTHERCGTKSAPSYYGRATHLGYQGSQWTYVMYKLQANIALHPVQCYGISSILSPDMARCLVMPGSGDMPIVDDVFGLKAWLANMVEIPSVIQATTNTGAKYRTNSCIKMGVGKESKKFFVDIASVMPDSDWLTALEFKTRDLMLDVLKEWTGCVNYIRDGFKAHILAEVQNLKAENYGLDANYALNPLMFDALLLDRLGELPKWYRYNRWMLDPARIVAKFKWRLIEYDRTYGEIKNLRNSDIQDQPVNLNYTWDQENGVFEPTDFRIWFDNGRETSNVFRFMAPYLEITRSKVTEPSYGLYSRLAQAYLAENKTEWGKVEQPPSYKAATNIYYPFTSVLKPDYSTLHPGSKFAKHGFASSGAKKTRALTNSNRPPGGTVHPSSGSSSSGTNSTTVSSVDSGVYSMGSVDSKVAAAAEKVKDKAIVEETKPDDSKPKTVTAEEKKSHNEKGEPEPPNPTDSTASVPVDEGNVSDGDDDEEKKKKKAALNPGKA